MEYKLNPKLEITAIYVRLKSKDRETPCKNDLHTKKLIKVVKCKKVTLSGCLD